MLTRRDFFGTVAIGAGTIGIASSEGQMPHAATPPAATSAAEPEYGFLIPGQVRTVEALVNQIIPADDKFPGGKDAGVVKFLDNALSGWLRANRWDYVAGIDGVNQCSRILFTNDFADLPFEAQTDVLQRIERGDVPGSAWAKENGPAFMGLLVPHSMQGYYGGPEYGGNKDHSSWMMINWMDMGSGHKMGGGHGR